jgi:hypothetical protein
VIIHNRRDLRRTEQRWPEILILTPFECQKEIPVSTATLRISDDA